METIRKAGLGDAEAALSLYHSLIGTPGCTWDEGYPNQEYVQSDIEGLGLFLLYEEDGSVIGAAALTREEAIDDLPCWSKDIRKPCALARIGVRAEVQGRGLAKRLVRFMEEEAKDLGFDGLHFLASQTNPRALRLYEGLGYRNVGKTVMYGIDWFCYEKAL